MSRVTEKINQLKQEQLRQQQLEEQQRRTEEARRLREEQEEEQEREQRIREEERKRQEDQKRRESHLKESGVLKGMEEIEKEFLSEVKRHDIIIMGSSAKLVWGNKYRIGENGYIAEEGGFLGIGGGFDCSEISAIVENVENNDFLTIRGYKIEAQLSEDIWRTNPDRIADALGRSFLSPKRNGRTVEADSYSSSSSSDTECCHGG